MNTGDVLLEEILGNPADDTPRLVYADWLMDNGREARGEFIRLQVELHHEEPGYTLDCRRSPKVHEKSANPKIRRAMELLREFSAQGMAAAWQEPEIPLSCWADLEWRRGFVCALSPSCDDFLRWAWWFFSHHPVEKASLSDTKPYLGVGGRYAVLSESKRNVFARLTNWLPEEIFRLLRGGEVEAFIGDSHVSRIGRWPSVEVAQKAIDDACLAYGRSLRTSLKEPAK